MSRKVGNAVERNRVKRRVREWFRRRHPGAGRAVDVVVIARRPAVELRGEALFEALDELTVRSLGDER